MRRSSASTVPVTRSSASTRLIWATPIFTPMLCMRWGVSCTGASGVSDAGAAFKSAEGSELLFVSFERTAGGLSLVCFSVSFFMAVSLLSAPQFAPGRFHDRRVPAGIGDQDPEHRERTQAGFG